jgi:hypothetical protein
MSDAIHFTPQEANRTLPLVKRIVKDIQETGRQLRKTAEELGESAADDPGIRKQMGELEDLFHELEQIGCSYKDPHFTVGLVDFPAIIDGEEACSAGGVMRRAWPTTTARRATPAAGRSPSPVRVTRANETGHRPR